MIIIEGPDGSGKTTLAKMICSAFNYKYIHSPGKTNIKEIANDRCWWYNQFLGDKVVLDRCYIISEYIHGAILRETSLISHEQVLEFMDRFNAFRNSLFILCNQQLKHKRNGNIEDEIKAEQNIKLITTKYKELYYIIKLDYRYQHITSIEQYQLLFNIIRSFHER